MNTMLLDRLMPEHQFSEVHSILLSAPPGGALEAVERVTLGEIPLVRLLFAVRSLPARAAGRRGLPTEKDGPLLGQMLDLGFFRLAEERGRELVFGGVGQMFEPRGGMAPTIADPGEFVAFREPGYAKVAMNFSVEPAGGLTRLVTETRVQATDPDARRKFGRYWRLIRPGSAAIRHSWLRAAKRRAERGAGPAASPAMTG